jgi:hypothetical protein
MAATVGECTIEVVVEQATEAREGGVPAQRMTTETEADKIRRQLRLRRKMKIARRALMARRSR